MNRQVSELKRNKCIGCGRKINENEGSFCLLCKKIIQDEYINEVVKDGI